MPNAFTPNDDGKNDTFAPVGLTEGAFNYQFAIWNRWGLLGGMVVKIMLGMFCPMACMYMYLLILIRGGEILN